MKDYNYNLNTEYAKNILYRMNNLICHTKGNIIYFTDRFDKFENFAMYVNPEIMRLVEDEKQRLKKKHNN